MSKRVRVILNLAAEAANRLDSLANADNCSTAAVVNHLLMGRMSIQGDAAVVPEIAQLEAAVARLKAENEALDDMAEDQAYLLADCMGGILHAATHVFGKCQCPGDGAGQVACACATEDALRGFVVTGEAPDYKFGLRPFAGTEETRKRHEAIAQLRADLHEARTGAVDWSQRSAAAVWRSAETMPKVAGPWVTVGPGAGVPPYTARRWGPGPDEDEERACLAEADLTGWIVETDVWRFHKLPDDISASREAADEALRREGWLLVDDDTTGAK